jgi:hypothetical protein
MLISISNADSSKGNRKGARNEKSENRRWRRRRGRRLSPVSPPVDRDPQERASIRKGWLDLLRANLRLEPLAAVATIVGTLVSLLGLLQSRAWLLLTSLVFVCVAIFAGYQARKGRLAMEAASIVIEGHSIDSLNVANLRRRVNRTFFVQDVQHTVRIAGEDMGISWRYSGYCRSDGTAAMGFSLDSDSSTPFERLNCVGYDLGRDPDMNHPIRPILTGAESISKKLSVPFLAPLRTNEPFGVLLKCTLPHCVKPGFSYYTSTLSFAQDRVRRCTVRLIFVGSAPSWVRVYECVAQGPAKLLKNLVPSRREANEFEYLDVVEDRPGESARIYVFWRDSA